MPCSSSFRAWYRHRLHDGRGGVVLARGYPAQKSDDLEVDRYLFRYRGLFYHLVGLFVQHRFINHSIIVRNEDIDSLYRKQLP